VLFVEDEGVEDAEGFVDGPAEGKVVDELVADDAGFVDEEEAAVGDAILFFENVEAAGDRFIEIGDEGVGDSLDPSFGLGGAEPGEMGKAAVDGTADDLGASFLKVFESLLEGMEFSGTDEGKVEGVKEE